MNKIIKAVLGIILKKTEEELYEQYKVDVIDCHPFKDRPVPISFEEWKESI